MPQTLSSLKVVPRQTFCSPLSFVDHISNDTNNDVGNDTKNDVSDDVKDIICGFNCLSSDKFHKEQPWACLGIINGIL
jgi:hypothetical protein